MKTTEKLVASALIALALTSLAAVNSQAQNGNLNPGIIPLNAHYGGHSYGEWLATEIQWEFGLPLPDNPNYGLGGSISNGQPKELWFLPVVFFFMTPEKTFHVTVPSGKALCLQVAGNEFDNFLCVSPPTNFSVDQLRQMAIASLDPVTVLEVDVDGVPVNNPKQYLAVSPAFNITLPEDNVLDAFLGCANPAGTYGPAVAAAFQLLFAPLPVGQHTIHQHIEASAYGVNADVTWDVTVVPHGR